MGCAHPCEVIRSLYTCRITSATHPSAHDGLTSVDEAAVSGRLARALDPDRSAGGTAAIVPCFPLDFGYCCARCKADIRSVDLRKAERWTARNPRHTLLATPTTPSRSFRLLVAVPSALLHQVRLSIDSASVQPVYEAATCHSGRKRVERRAHDLCVVVVDQELSSFF